MNSSILTLGNFRYLKFACTLMIVAIAIFVIDDPLGPPNGGTWVGYSLGTVGALLICWLAWFGIRKRRYGIGKFSLQEWLSAHVYLGISLIVIATLHAGFQFGLNIHTLAYILMLLVIVSGVYGLYLYVQVPEVMARNRGGLTIEEIMASVTVFDVECRPHALVLGDEINDLIRDAAENTRVGGGLWEQVSGKSPNCPTALALQNVSELTKSLREEEAIAGRQLVTLLARKNEMLLTARRDVRYRALLNLWLLLHVPLSVGLLAALVIHIVTVFFYR